MPMRSAARHLYRCRATAAIPAGSWGILDVQNEIGGQNNRLDDKELFTIRINPVLPLFPASSSPSASSRRKARHSPSAGSRHQPSWQRTTSLHRSEPHPYGILHCRYGPGCRCCSLPAFRHGMCITVAGIHSPVKIIQPSRASMTR
jgi:hypothetical protein